MRAMKDSGVGWIGEIPETFNLLRTRFLCSITTGNKDTIDRTEDGKYPFFVRSQTIEKIDTYSFDGEAVLTAGDGDVGKIFHFINGKFDFHQRVYKFSDFNKVTGKFFYHYIFSNFGYELGKYSAKTTVESLRLPWLKDFPVVIPPIKEQQKIAEYLDEKVVLIDEVIEKTKRSIEEYKKYKQSLITETVTKGLNPNARMKDSGIEWIGAIPEHWEVTKPHAVCQIIRGNCGFQKDDLKDNGDYVALQYGKTYKVDIIDGDYRFFVGEEFLKETQLIKKGFTLLISTSETIEDLGHSCYYTRDDLGLLGGEQICLNPSELVIGKFLYYVSRYFKLQLNQYATGLKVYRYRVDDLKKINIIIPPLKEQNSIVNFLDSHVPMIHKIIYNKNTLVSELETYKKSLIYEVVTGKKEIQ